MKLPLCERIRDQRQTLIRLSGVNRLRDFISRSNKTQGSVEVSESVTADIISCISFRHLQISPSTDTIEFFIYLPKPRHDFPLYDFCYRTLFQVEHSFNIKSSY